MFSTPFLLFNTEILEFSRDKQKQVLWLSVPYFVRNKVFILKKAVYKFTFIKKRRPSRREIIWVQIPLEIWAKMRSIKEIKFSKK